MLTCCNFKSLFVAAAYFGILGLCFAPFLVILPYLFFLPLFVMLYYGNISYVSSINLHIKYQFRNKYIGVIFFCISHLVLVYLVLFLQLVIL